MTEADLPRVAAIERGSFLHPWSDEMLRRELNHAWSTLLVAEEAGRGGPLVGFILFWKVHDELHILNVATDPLRRRQGIARALLEACLEEGRRAGTRAATLEVRRSNLAAQALYSSRGFRAVGVRKGYYAEENEDAVLMSLDLTSVMPVPV